MEQSKTKKLMAKKRIVSFVVALGVVLATLIPVLHLTSNRYIVSNGQVLDDNWTININDQDIYSDVILSQTSFPVVGKGDRIVLTRTFEDEANIDYPVLRLYSVHSVVRVYVEDKLIYSYGEELAKQGLMLGYGYHFVNLTDGYAQKELKIVFDVTENDAYTGIPVISIDDSRTYLQQKMSGDRVRLAGALLLIMFGAFAMLVSCFMILKDIKFKQFFCIATFSVLIGVWTLCNNDMIIYFSQNLLVKCYLEFISIYALPLPFLWYFADRVKLYDETQNLTRKGIHKGIFNWMLPSILGRSRKSIGHALYWTIFNLQVLFLIVVIVTQLFNWVHLPSWLHLSHCFMGGDILFVVIIFVESVRRGGTVNKGVQWGMGIIFAFLLFELIRYNVDKYLFSFTGNTYNSTLCFGALAIVVALLIDFTNQIAGTLFEKAQQTLLEEMAYTDKLTGLANRRRCDDALAEADTGNLNYAILSLDLNLLKYYNDHYGHNKGDALIQTFADVLKETFEQDALVCRNGGDEFMVLIPDIDHWDEEKHKSRYYELLTQANENFVEMAKWEGDGKEPMRLSCAHGKAKRSELPKGSDSHSVYRLADKRMYECKRRMKDKGETTEWIG